uniref:Interleukin-2 receptor subunit alpha n=1 Tax=Neovison vison TaxID=452646 RepID=A0A8C7ENP7_NEOVI
MLPFLPYYGDFMMTTIFQCGYLCDDNPPSLKHAAYKALEYRTGTMLNCGCERGFRRLNSVMRCAGNSSHASWENQCQCVPSKSTEGQVTPKPEEEKQEATRVRGTPPELPVPVPGHCREPPSWDHEDSERIYHFVVGQTVHYQCAPGFRALRRGSAESVCKTVSGKTQWTRPQLKCISDREDGRFPGTEGPAWARPPDFRTGLRGVQFLAPGALMNGFSVTVAGCVLLLISVLLLSGLTWQRRR